MKGPQYSLLWTVLHICGDIVSRVFSYDYLFNEKSSELDEVDLTLINLKLENKKQANRKIRFFANYLIAQFKSFA
jgi:primosomal protein N''